MTWPSSPTTYRGQVIVDRRADEVRLLTVPPIHAARVTREGRAPLWRVRWVSMPMRADRFYVEELAAIREAASVISKAAGLDWRDKFVGVQRLAIGQSHCPKIVKGLDLGEMDICRKSPEIGTIWCKDHLSVIRGNDGS